MYILVNTFFHVVLDVEATEKFVQFTNEKFVDVDSLHLGSHARLFSVHVTKCMPQFVSAFQFYSTNLVFEDHWNAL